MKIMLPTRELYFVIAFALFSFLPDFLQAQCNTCPASSRTLDGCLAEADNRGLFDLSTIPSTGTVEYYMDCTGMSGMLSNEITGADIMSYEGQDAELIYVQVLDGMNCDSIFTVTLNILNNSCPATSSEILDGCPTQNANEGIFDLSDITTLPSTTVKYYKTCSGSGNLSSNQITGGSITAYTGMDGESIFVEQVDTDGCVTIKRVTLNVLDISVSITLDPVSGAFCSGGNVELTANIMGGSGTTTYSWTTASGSNPMSASIVGATAGDYSVEATRNGCTVESETETLVNQSIAIANTSRTNVTCNGLDDGTYSVTVTGGSGTYNYNLTGGKTISNGDGTVMFTGLAPGDYSVTVTDVGGAMCNISSGNALEITEPAALTMTLAPTAPTTVGGSDGKILVNVSNGTGNYNWNYETPVQTNKSGSAPSSSFFIMDLKAGDYDITVTDQNGMGCTVTGMVTVPNLVCNFNISNTSPTAPDCRDGNNGSIVVTTTGRTGNYDLDWSRSEGGSDSEDNNSSNSVTIPNLLPGTYSITVTDAANCSSSVTNVTVANPPQITFSLSQDQPACAGVANGVIQVNSISNGTSPYVVKWNGPGSNNSGELPPSTNTSPTITGLVAGSYSITVQDVNGCAPAPKTQAVSELSAVNVSIVGDGVFCFNEGNGMLSTSPSNFSDYDWSTGAGTSSITIPNPGATSINYLVTVTDGSGCTGSNIISVSRLPDVTVSLNAGASKTSVTCDSDCDGRIDINKGGGTGSFTYSWKGPGNFSRTTEDIENLCPGDYTLTITDSQEGCTKTFSQTISVPQSITASASASDATCFGDSNGAVTVSADGGTPFGGGTYQYLWSPGGSNTQTISNLSAGTYRVTVTDANGCFKTAQAIVNEPNAVTGVITASDTEICNGQSVNLTASGGTSFLWTGGLGSNATVNVSPTSTTTYNVMVTDAATNNCTDQASIAVTVNQLPTAGIGVAENSGNANNDRIICEGKPVTITASGGVTYNWSGGFSNPLTVSPPAGSETYSVTVTDGNGCTDTDEVEIQINENPTALIDFSSASQTIADIQNIKNNSSANCEDLVNCSWTADGSPIPGNNCDGITPTFNTGGSKTIKLLVENSCGCTSEASSILEIFASDQCAVEEFKVNEGLGVACVGEELDIIVGERATPNCFIVPDKRKFEVFRNGTLLTNGNEYDYDVSSITFKAPGNYDMRYTIEDNCECTRPSTRNIEVVPAPSISFMSGNPSVGCEGESLNIQFDGFDEGERVVVQYENGNIFTYEADNFDLLLGEKTSERLTILSVKNSTCEVEVENQSFNINIVPKFEIVSQTTKCTEDGLSYTMTIETSGGEAGASIIADGIVGTGSGANSYIIPNLDPTQEYSFILTKGSVCDPIEVDIPMIVCNCTFFVGTNDVSGFSGCEDDIFSIPLDDIFDTSKSDFDPETDTLIYVLHDQNTGLSLGRVYKIFPSSTTELSNDFPGFVPNLTTYRLSIVGLRKATLDDFDFDNPQSLNNAGSGRCLSVVSGIPVIWYRAPSPKLGTANNSQFICRNSYDYMIFAKDLQQGSTVAFDIEGLPDEFIKNYGFQDTSFVHFLDSGQDSFNVTITESKEYFDGSTTFTCEGQTTVTLYVEDGPGSPPPSEVILWPGNIFASTADPSTTCFEWGFFNFGEQSGIIGTEKYLYAANDINIETSGRVYFVDTYLCDNPDCVTRIFYNAAGPTPGLNYKEEEAFSYLIKPNPSRGQFVLDLFSEAEGDYSLRILDLTGKPVLDTNVEFSKGQNSKEFDLTNVPKGVYFIQIVNTTLNEYSIDKIVIN